MRWTHNCFIKLICYVSLTLLVVVPSRGQSPVDPVDRYHSTVCPYSGRVYSREPIMESPTEVEPSTEVETISAAVATNVTAPEVPATVASNPSASNDNDYREYDYSEYDYSEYDYSDYDDYAAVAGAPVAVPSDNVSVTVNTVAGEVAAEPQATELSASSEAEGFAAEAVTTAPEVTTVVPAPATAEDGNTAEGEGWEYEGAEYDYYVEEFETIREAEFGSAEVTAEPDTRPYEEIVDEVSNDGFREYDADAFAREEGSEAETAPVAVDQCREEMVEAETLVEDDGVSQPDASTVTENLSPSAVPTEDPYAQEVYAEEYHLETGYDAAYDEAMSPLTRSEAAAENTVEADATEEVANEDTVYDAYLAESWAFEEDAVEATVTAETVVESVTDEATTEVPANEEGFLDETAGSDSEAEAYSEDASFEESWVEEVEAAEVVTEEVSTEDASLSDTSEGTCEVCPTRVDTFEDGYCHYYGDDYLCDLADDAVEAESACPESDCSESDCSEIACPEATCPYTGKGLDLSGDDFADEMPVEAESFSSEAGTEEFVVGEDADAIREAVEMNELGCDELNADQTADLSAEPVAEEPTFDASDAVEPAPQGAIFVYQFYECEGYLYYDYDGYDLLAVDVVDGVSEEAVEHETPADAVAVDEVGATTNDVESAPVKSGTPFPYLAPCGVAAWLMEQEASSEHPLKAFVEEPTPSVLPATEPVLDNAPRAAQAEGDDRQQAAVAPATDPLAATGVDWEAAAEGVVRGGRVAMNEAFQTLIIAASAWDVQKELEVARSFTPTQR